MHKTIKVIHDNISADIDELIAPLIKTMWEANIKTSESCQGDNGIARIHFNGAEYPRKFLEMVWEPEPEALEVSVKTGGLPIGFPFHLKWNTWLNPIWNNGQVDYHIMISFPHRYIDICTQRIKDKRI